MTRILWINPVGGTDEFDGPIRGGYLIKHAAPGTEVDVVSFERGGPTTSSTLSTRPWWQLTSCER